LPHQGGSGGNQTWVKFGGDRWRKKKIHQPPEPKFGAKELLQKFSGKAKSRKKERKTSYLEGSDIEETDLRKRKEVEPNLAVDDEADFDQRHHI